MIEITRIRIYKMNGSNTVKVWRLGSIRMFESKSAAEEFRATLQDRLSQRYKDYDVKVAFDTKVVGSKWINLK